jgi:hypothetical protein
MNFLLLFSSGTVTGPSYFLTIFAYNEFIYEFLMSLQINSDDFPELH